jgi:hypothetical protein
VKSSQHHILITTITAYPVNEGGYALRPVEITEIGNYRKRMRFWRWRAWRQNNPLRRQSTPIERMVALAVAVLAAALLTATAFAVRASAASAQHTAESTHAVDAVVASTDPSDPGVVQPATGLGSFTTHLRWKWRGFDRSTDLPTLMPPADGSTITVRVDDSGRSIDDPWSSDNPVTAGIGTALGGSAISGAILVTALAALRQWRLRRRAALWQTEWEHIAPLWTGRRF